MMGLEIPNLDTKRYAERIGEAMALLPSLSGEWSDFNPSDPGITILELLAWLADVDAYRFNRITEAHRRAFLKIAGMAPKPPKPARVVLAFAKKGDMKKIPKGTCLTSDSIPFVTERQLIVTGCEIASILTEGFGEGRRQESMPFYPFGTHLRRGFRLVLEFEESVEGTLWLYFKVREISVEPAGSGTLSWAGWNDASSEWEALTVEDGTCGLRRSGFVKLQCGTKCRKIAAILTDADRYENLPLIEAIVPDAVWATQQVPKEKELGESSGYANQHYMLERDIDPLSLEVRVGEDASATFWRRVEDLRDALPDDEVYMLEDDRIRFGDGGYGKIPPRGEKIVASFMACEGSRGNLPAGSSWRFEIERMGGESPPPFSVSNPLPAEGGADAEDMAALFAAFQDRLQRVERAVTLEDYERLALRTPGTTLARAVATADPRKNRVTVTLVPESERPMPTPAAGTLQRVRTYLQERRLVTTKVDVASPRYAGVSVSARVRIETFDADGVRREIAGRLERYLHPLHGGLKRRGWIDTKRLYITEIYLLLSREIESLLSIDALMVTLRRPDGRVVRRREGYVETDAGTLFASGDHRIDVRVPENDRCGGVL